MNIGIVGLGLIGGSLAKAIKRHTKHTVWGFDIAQAEMEKAQLVGAIDSPLTTELLPACAFVIIALYPKDIVRYLKENAPRFGEGAVVVDCGGVKQVICGAVQDGNLQSNGWYFIGGHPMAGREYWGFRYAQDDLFENASMILTPDSDTPLEVVSATKEFFLDIGFRRVIFSTPENHDEMIAYTSQMAHIISSAYVCSELARKHKGFSAGSFQDMTRVARLNEHMWSELFLLNRKPLVHELDDILTRLQAYRDAIVAGNEAQLVTLLREGRERKELLDE